MLKKIKIWKSIGAILLTLALLNGCGIATLSISDVLENPDRFKNQEVLLIGTVTESMKIPFVDTGAYQLDDGSGKIWVISKVIRNKGNKVIVAGNVIIGFELAGQKLGVVMRENN